MKHQQLIQRVFVLLITWLTVSHVGTVFAGVPPAFSFTFNGGAAITSSNGDNSIPRNQGGTYSPPNNSGGTNGQNIIKYRVKVKETTTTTSITNDVNVSVYWGHQFTNPATREFPASTTITVNQPPPTYSLTTQASGPGTVSSGGSYAAGATVTLTATAGAGSTFMGWSPSPCAASFAMPGSQLTCTATFSTATFTPPPPPPDPTKVSFFLKVDGNGSGKVTTDVGVSCQTSDCDAISSDEDSSGVKCNAVCQTVIDNSDGPTSVTLTPHADSGSIFSGWGGNEDCVDGQLLITGGKLCIAFFRRIYSLTVAVQGAGQVMGYDDSSQQSVIDCGAKCQAAFSDDSRVSLQATPSQGMTFSGWSGECGNSTPNPLTLEINKDIKCLATFVTPAPVVTPTPVTVTPPVTSTTPSVTTTPVTTETTGNVPSTSPTPAVTTATTTGNVPSTSPTPVVTTETLGNVPPTPAVTTETTGTVPTMSPTPATPPPVVTTPVVTAETTGTVPTTSPIPLTPPTQLPEAVVTSSVVVTPPPVVTFLPALLPWANFSCSPTGNIGEVCNYGGREVTNLNVQGSGIVSNGILATTVVNIGWVSNFYITATGKLTGGVVTGYIKNEGVMLDFEFVGMSIIGGTLGGTIRNNSRVGGYFQDVTLLPDTKIIGGILRGIIAGDKKKPALLENMRVKGRSKLSGVKLGKNVKLEKGVIVENN